MASAEEATGEDENKAFAKKLTEHLIQEKCTICDLIISECNCCQTSSQSKLLPNETTNGRSHLIDEFVASSKNQPPLDTNQFTEEEPDSSNTNHIEKNSLGDNDFKSNNFPESIIGNNQNSSDNQEINNKAVTFGQDDFMINGKCDTSDTMFSSENTHKERVIQEDTFVGVACDSMPEMSDVKNSDNNFETSLTNSNALVSTSEPNNGCDKNCTDESEVIIPNTTNNNIIDMQSKMKTEEICNGGITNLDKVAKIQIHGPCEDSFAVETNTGDRKSVV